MTLVVFDLDGTLVDSRKDLATAVNGMLLEYGSSPLPEADVTRMVGEGARVLVDRAMAAAGLPAAEAPRALDRFLALYDAHLLDHTRPYEGVLNLLEQLDGLANLAVLTNKPHRATTRVLEGLGLRRYFIEVIGGDQDLPRKPDPAGLLALVERCGAARDETLMIGDSRVDLETARKAGVACCLVRYGFGFPDGTLPPGVLIAETPAAVAELCAKSLHRAR